MPRAPRRCHRPPLPSRRRITALLVSAGALLAQSAAHAEEGRFDAQVFRPSAAPRDLVMVRKSEIIGHLSPSFGLGAEVYIIQRWGLSAIGEVYGYPSLTKFPDTPAQIPAEFLLGVRGQGKHGITITVGGSFGAACSFGAPAFRLWSSITWQPSKSREQEEINWLKEGQGADRDHDGLFGDADLCPNLAGPLENHGCPDEDSDGDGIVDREDACPDRPSGPGGNRGCPAIYIKGDKIVLAEEVHFADDKETILQSSRPVLEHVAEVLIEHPEILEVQIEDHTDVREADAHSVTLSQRRVESVRKYLIDKRGIDPARLVAKGFGHLEPVADDTGCVGPEEKLTPQCKSATSKNRGVVIRILRRGEPPSRALTFGRPAALPWGHVLPRPVLRWGGVLPQKPLDDRRTLPDRVLPWITPGEVGGVLPFRRVLPRAGTPRPEPVAPKDASPEDAAPKDAPK
jgi:OmpA-OmpF porin, OOP family